MLYTRSDGINGFGEFDSCEEMVNFIATEEAHGDLCDRIPKKLLDMIKMESNAIISLSKGAIALAAFEKIKSHLRT